MMRCAFILSVLCLLGAAHTVLAQDVLLKNTNIADKSSPIQIEKIEDIGIYTNANQKGFGEDLWRGSDRTLIVSLLKAMPANSTVPAIQKLINGVLLTSADSALLENDHDQQQGDDLFTLRMEKLTEGGAYDKAYKMYGMLENESYHPRLANAGILAMLHEGKKTSACLETKAAVEYLNQEGFNQDLTLYCSLSVRNRKENEALFTEKLKNLGSPVLKALLLQEDYKYPYERSDFNQLTPMEKAVLTAERKIDTSSLNIDEIYQVPPSHILPLLRQPDLTKEKQTFLTIQAVYWGLMEPDDLLAVYMQDANPASGNENPDIQQDVPAFQNVARLAYFYKNALNAPDEISQWNIVRDACHELAEIYSPAAFTPFTDMFYDYALESPSLDDLIVAYTVINQSGKTIPANWLNAINDLTDEDKKDERYKHLAAAVYFSKNGVSASSEDTEKADNAAQDITNAQLFSFNFIENVDKGEKPSNNGPTIYEKDFYLTFGKDYVMPSVDVWNHLQQASQTDAVGEVILLSTLIFRDRELRNRHPEPLKEVLQNLENVGLTNISRNMAVTASLRNIQTKEN